jgi:hypothetical protein
VSSDVGARGWGTGDDDDTATQELQQAGWRSTYTEHLIHARHTRRARCDQSGLIDSHKRQQTSPVALGVRDAADGERGADGDPRTFHGLQGLQMDHNTLFSEIPDTMCMYRVWEVWGEWVDHQRRTGATQDEKTDSPFDLAVDAPEEHRPTAYTSYSVHAGSGTVATGSRCKLVTAYAAVEVDTAVALFTAVNTMDSTEQAVFPPKLSTASSMYPHVTTV